MELQKTKDISYALKTIEGHFPAAFRPVAASPRHAGPQENRAPGRYALIR
ncbi:hypothetical protein BN890_28380 [Bacteroides xylanisolvens SD CC 1b]|uniref:Uncharacterized protein n=1 Tax=Bacteroides xylanisolvens SD CC 1b TaxID=702447 RepID=W6P6K0_9BACE|nr:hypothetical protein BN890_28380 [Bacteroides xylanisolvens SD CC 1b]